MKRNLDLVRLLLLDIESREEAFGSSDIRLPDFDTKEIAYHIGLLVQAGYLDVAALHNGADGVLYHIRGVTNAGHDYIDAVRKAKVWQRVKDNAAKAGISLTMQLAKEAALSVMKQWLGLAESD